MYLIVVNLDDPTKSVSVSLPEGGRVRLGRKPEPETPEEIETHADEDEDGGTDEDGQRPSSAAADPAQLLVIPWNDRLVNRNHSEASRHGDMLKLERLPSVKGRSRPNSFFTNAARQHRVPLQDPFGLSYGQSVVIGGQGNTAIYWLRSPADLSKAMRKLVADGVLEKSDRMIGQVGSGRYDDVALLDEYSLRLQLKLIQTELPDKVLSGWTTETGLYSRAGVFLESALPGQRGVAVAFLALEQMDEEHDGENGVRFEILNPDPNTRTDFQPSRTLLSQLNLDNPDPEDIRVWTSEIDQPFVTAQSLGRKIDWIVALPIASAEEDARVHRDSMGRPVYLYVETRQASDADAAAFIPFLRLIAALVAGLLEARARQRVQDRLSAYFSPTIREIIEAGEPAELEPSMADCTVIFCDRRGHSRHLERARTDDQILDRLRENQSVVGRITQTVFDHDGVVTDFAGDGALALWGWPDWLPSSAQHARRAVEAAERMVMNFADLAEFEEEYGRVMSPIRVGISTGRIAVGRTGPSQQWHISVFGSVANLGARLERIAKEFRVPVLVSAETVERLRGEPGTQRWRFRRLCLVKPAGFQRSYPIHELILPAAVGGSGASDETVRTYDEALELFLQRNWEACLAQLGQLPPDDSPGRWLANRARRYLASPPGPAWEGEIPSLTK